MTDSTTPEAAEPGMAVRARISLDPGVTLISLALGLNGPGIVIDLDPETTEDSLIVRVRAGGVGNMMTLHELIDTARLLIEEHPHVTIPPVEPTDEQVEAFKAAWLEADSDHEGPGGRTRAGLRAALSA